MKPHRDGTACHRVPFAEKLSDLPKAAHCGRMSILPGLLSTVPDDAYCPSEIINSTSFPSQKVFWSDNKLMSL